jgi:hypothetical protein
MDTEFYKQLKAFLKELIETFPDDHEIKVVSTKINLSCIEKDNKLIQKFYNNLKNLEHLIMVQDDQFFCINPDNHWTPGSNENILFTKLIFYWNEVSPSNKKVIWDYIKLLYQLSSVVNV